MIFSTHLKYQYIWSTFKFRLSERLSEISLIFDLSLVLHQTLAQWKAQQKLSQKVKLPTDLLVSV